MHYFDNAATTRQKPEEVYDAFNYYVREILGGIGSDVGMNLGTFKNMMIK